MSGNNDELEVYTYRGSQGEEVPETVEKLIVEEGVQALPQELCHGRTRLRQVTLPTEGLLRIEHFAFLSCRLLLEITIGNSVQYIGDRAFGSCVTLTKVNFEFSTSSPHQLRTIDGGAFSDCISLSRIKLPASVKSFAEQIFGDCRSLMEADLSETCVTEITNSAFLNCYALQSVSLPNTVGSICNMAFMGCSALVTVIIPLDSKSINIGSNAFLPCRRLAILELPKGSCCAQPYLSFGGCMLLREHFGENNPPIVAGLIDRFVDLPIHRLCYHNSAATTTVDALRQCIANQREDSLMVDRFGMTPFHILLSTISPRTELLEVLLDLLPNRLVNSKDADGERPLEYLIRNWNPGKSTSLLSMTLQKSMIDPLMRWGSKQWADEMKCQAGRLLFEHRKKRRLTLLDEMYSTFQHHEKTESTLLLELSLWKGKLKCGFRSEDSDGPNKRQAMDRTECRCLCGSDVVIPNITAFLW